MESGPTVLSIFDAGHVPVSFDPVENEREGAGDRLAEHIAVGSTELLGNCDGIPAYSLAQGQ